MNDTPTKNDLQLYTVKQVAELCVVTQNTVRIWINDGRMTALKLPAGWRVKRADLVAFLKVYYHAE